MFSLVLGFLMLATAVVLHRRMNGLPLRPSLEEIRHTTPIGQRLFERGDGTRTRALPMGRTDRTIVGTAPVVAVIVAAVMGGSIPALLLLGAITVSLIPFGIINLKRRRELRALLESGRLTADEDLYVPAAWQQ